MQLASMGRLARRHLELVRVALLTALLCIPTVARGDGGASDDSPPPPSSPPEHTQPTRVSVGGYFGPSLFIARGDDVEGGPTEASAWVLARLSIGGELRAWPLFVRGGASMRLAGRAYGEQSSERTGYGVEAALGVDITCRLRMAVRFGIETTNIATVGLRVYPVHNAYIGIDLFHVDRAEETGGPQLQETNVSIGAGFEQRPKWWTAIVVGVAVGLAAAVDWYDARPSGGM
jgi:hypothetical protein